MALNITSQVTTDSGIDLSTSYGRVTVNNPESGELLICGLQWYPSEAAYTAGVDPLRIKDPNGLIPGDLIPTFMSTPYDRATDGTDTLQIAHDFIQSELDSKSISSTQVL